MVADSKSPHREIGRAAAPSRAPVWIVAIVLAATAFKVWLAMQVDGVHPVLDEGQYLRLAGILAEEGRFEGTFRPPLYPAFMALHLKLGWGTLGVRLTQVGLSTLTAAFAFRLARRMAGRRPASVAAVLVALDPVLGMFSIHLWSETLFIFLCMAAWELLAGGAARESRPMRHGIAGVLVGLACLTRPMLLTFVPLLAAWCLARVRRVAAQPTTSVVGSDTRTFRSSRQTGATPTTSVVGSDGAGAGATWRCGLINAVAVCAACCLTIAPWTIRNARVAQAFIPVDCNGAFNFLVGTQSESAFVAKDNVWDRRYGVVDGVPYEPAAARDAGKTQQRAIESALANIRADVPRFVRKSLWEAGHLWTLDSFLLRHLRNGWYGPAQPATATPALTPLSAAFSLLLVVAGLVGLAVAASRGERGLFVLLILHSTVLFGLTYALSRYAVPLRPLLAIGAAIILVKPAAIREAWRAGAARRIALTIAAAAVIALAAAWTSDWPLLRDMWATGGTNFRFQMR